MKVGKLLDSVMPITFFQTFDIMKGTTAETGLKVTTAIKLHSAIPEKGMAFPGVLKKEHVEIPGLN